MADNVVTREDVPEYVMSQLARCLLETMPAIEAYFNDPENEKKYQEWKAARDAARR